MKKLILSLAFLPGILLAQGPIKVEVVPKGDGFELLRGGQPYYVNGAGGHTYLDELLARGGNSIRTWSTDDGKEILDEAHKRGLTVMMGLWVGHERHGFDYDDERAVAKQLEGFKKQIDALKDHPALLFWGIGNEVDLNYSNTKVWNAIEDIAKYIHKVDPNHPTSTVTAGLDAEEVKLIKANCPSIDIYCVNTYGDLANVPNNISKYGWQGPYMITEWGPNGHWEVGKTAWGAPIEQTSTEKKASYRERYMEHISKKKDRCLGSYVFLWGQKQETTATWYGLFIDGGKRTETLDVLQECWKGALPTETAPTIKALNLDGRKAEDNIKLNAKAKYPCMISIGHADTTQLKYDWAVIPESMTTGTGGDKEAAPDELIGLMKKRKKAQAIMTAPAQSGAYRLFVVVTDNGNRAAYANIPFYVMPQEGDDFTGNLRLKPVKDNSMIGPSMP